MGELAETVERAASGLGIAGRESARERVYEAGGSPFATVSGRAAEFRVGAVVAAAARATPGAAASTRGGEWVRFEPAAVDRFARDRATAWFTLAWRAAVSGARPYLENAGGSSAT